MSEETDQKSGPIVCATRGGEVSRRTQQRAVELARDRDALLIFFFAVDTSFAAKINERLDQALDDEMAYLGRTLLHIARSRAERQGVKAQAIVRRGPVTATLTDYLREVNAATLILGAPREDSDHHSFEPGEIDKFADKIRQETGIEVLVVK